jgi:hypothetical protein
MACELRRKPACVAPETKSKYSKNAHQEEQDRSAKFKPAIVYNKRTKDSYVRAGAFSLANGEQWTLEGYS